MHPILRDSHAPKREHSLLEKTTCVVLCPYSTKLRRGIPAYTCQQSMSPRAMYQISRPATRSVDLCSFDTTVVADENVPMDEIARWMIDQMKFTPISEIYVVKPSIYNVDQNLAQLHT